MGFEQINLIERPDFIAYLITTGQPFADFQTIPLEPKITVWRNLYLPGFNTNLGTF